MRFANGLKNVVETLRGAFAVVGIGEALKARAQITTRCLNVLRARLVNGRSRDDERKFLERTKGVESPHLLSVGIAPHERMEVVAPRIGFGGDDPGLHRVRTPERENRNPGREFRNVEPRFGPEGEDEVHVAARAKALRDFGVHLLADGLVPGVAVVTVGKKAHRPGRPRQGFPDVRREKREKEKRVTSRQHHSSSSVCRTASIVMSSDCGMVPR